MIYLGLMSGTSVDAIDAVLARFTPSFDILARDSSPIAPDTRAAILALAEGDHDDLDALGTLDRHLGEQFADAANRLIEHSGIPRQQICAIGSHGQTVRHRPELGFTLQIGDPSRIAELTGIRTIADFRRRDVAAGGQGAPLVPAFHRDLFQTTSADRVIVNIGGMANLTSLPAGQPEAVTGFDTGPGNVLLDAWMQHCQNRPCDLNGAWGASGQPNETLLAALLDEPFFRQPPPKSTGREMFHLNWLRTKLNGLGSTPAAADVQATLVELTARSIRDSILPLGLARPAVFVCGGGAHNSFLMQRLQALLPHSHVGSTAELGLDPDWVEAAAFAWLAWRTDQNLSGNLPAVTGAQGERVLGAIYPA